MTGFYTMAALVFNELMIVINNFIPNKTCKFDYEEPVWMKKEIILYLKIRSNLTKKYYNSPTNHGTNLINTGNESTGVIIATK